MHKVLLFRIHGFHDRQCGVHVIQSPVGIADLSAQTVGLDGVQQPVRIRAAVPVDRQQVQLVLAPENVRVPGAEQKIVKKTQVKVGVIGN